MTAVPIWKGDSPYPCTDREMIDLLGYLANCRGHITDGVSEREKRQLFHCLFYTRLFP